MLFEDLSLSKSIQKPYLSKAIYPTPIQEQSIPIVLWQRFVGCAQTGTGKTGAFAIPIIHQLHRLLVLQRKQTSLA
jgi:ATP-dependent RNA helicase RhlE